MARIPQQAQRSRATSPGAPRGQRQQEGVRVRWVDGVEMTAENWTELYWQWRMGQPGFNPQRPMADLIFRAHIQKRIKVWSGRKAHLLRANHEQIFQAMARAKMLTIL